MAVAARMPDPNALPTPVPPLSTAVAVPIAAPVGANERITTLDLVRGLAVLGILVMNVVQFGQPLAAYENPLAGGGSQGLDRWVWGMCRKRCSTARCGRCFRCCLALGWCSSANGWNARAVGVALPTCWCAGVCGWSCSGSCTGLRCNGLATSCTPTACWGWSRRLPGSGDHVR